MDQVCCIRAMLQPFKVCKVDPRLVRIARFVALLAQNLYTKQACCSPPERMRGSWSYPCPCPCLSSPGPKHLQSRCHGPHERPRNLAVDLTPLPLRQLRGTFAPVFILRNGEAATSPLAPRLAISHPSTSTSAPLRGALPLACQAEPGVQALLWPQTRARAPSSILAPAGTFA